MIQPLLFTLTASNVSITTTSYRPCCATNGILSNAHCHTIQAGLSSHVHHHYNTDSAIHLGNLHRFIPCRTIKSSVMHPDTQPFYIQLQYIATCHMLQAVLCILLVFKVTLTALQYIFCGTPHRHAIRVLLCIQSALR
jgi:hypothetical protein